jgi:hypothetical protein
MVQILTDGNLSLPDFKGNSELILTAGRWGWWVDNGTAEPFSSEMRNGIWNFGVR